jgi:flotillin
MKTLIIFNQSGKSVKINPTGIKLSSTGTKLNIANANIGPIIQKRKYSVYNTLLSEEIVMFTGLSATLITGFVAFAVHRFKVSDPNQYLVRTGLGIDDILISKTGFQFPFQKYMFVSMIPHNYSFNIHAMSSQKLKFVLPVAFTIGIEDNKESLKKYSKFLLTKDGDSSYIDETIKGIIEGETRVLAAQMTIEEIFNDRATFKQKIIENVQNELNQFGLLIYNSNVKELSDDKDSEYFYHMSKKILSEAEGQAKVNIANAKKMSDIGQKEHEIQTRIKVAEFEVKAIEAENDRKKKIAESNAELAIIQAEAKRKTDLANIEVNNMIQQKDLELQKIVQEKKIATETETLRAKDFSKTNVQAEISKRHAEGIADAAMKEADAEYYKQIKKAEGDALFKLKLAEAESQSQMKLADALLYHKSKEAEGIELLYSAQSRGMQQLVNSFNGDSNALLQYLMVDKKVFQELADANARAIHGLEPKIHVWNTTTGNNSDDYTSAIRNIGQVLPPLFKTIYEQTGLKPSDSIINGLNGLNGLDKK